MCPSQKRVERYLLAKAERLGLQVDIWDNHSPLYTLRDGDDTWFVGWRRVAGGAVRVARVHDRHA